MPNHAARLIITLCTATALTACQKEPQPSGIASTAPRADAAPVDPNELCITMDFSREGAEHCQPGQRIAFLPDRWGNEQLPLLFVAANCDLTRSVALTNGGVVCQYMPSSIKTEGDTEAPVSEDESG